MEVADGWKTKGRDFGRMKILGLKGGGLLSMKHSIPSMAAKGFIEDSQLILQVSN